MHTNKINCLLLLLILRDLVGGEPDVAGDSVAGRAGNLVGFYDDCL